MRTCQVLTRFMALGMLLLRTLTPTSGALLFPTSSAYGIIAAIAVPLDLPHRNVFLSYNFEANYNLPNVWELPANLADIEYEDFYEGRHLPVDSTGSSNVNASTSASASNTTTPLFEHDESTAENEEAAHRQRRSLLSRTHFYQILQDKFEKSGYAGQSCLLRLICEVNSSELGDVNGVLGSVMHVLFSPSTSMYERLPLPYYQAEVDGQHDLCEQHYVAACQESILDLISAPLDEIINSL